MTCETVNRFIADDKVLSDVDGDFEKYENIGADKLFSEASNQTLNSHKAKQCYSAELSVPTPEAFQFPYQPYDIQIQLMKCLYEALELGKIGIFESPTGTGKSLSLICGALTWLKDFEERRRQELGSLLSDKAREKVIAEKPKCDKEPDWIMEFEKKREIDEITQKLKEEEEMRQKREAKLQQVRSNLLPPHIAKRKRDPLEEQFNDLYAGISKEMQDQLDSSFQGGSNAAENEGDEDIVVEEYVSDDETLTSSSENKDSEDYDLGDHVTKIYYCSRTHSQLSQFVHEIQRSPFNDSTKVVSLASRQNLCINEAVKRLKSVSLINERCLELQKSKQSSQGEQSYLRTSKMSSHGNVEDLSRAFDSMPSLAERRGRLTCFITTRSKVKADTDVKRPRSASRVGCPFNKMDPLMEFRDRVLVEISDIEQLTTLGKKTKACPYYGTRYAIPAAQIVVLPYNTLLHKSTRESCGIRLTGNVVIIDEGHNLLETISCIHSVQVSGSQLCCAHSQLTQYMERYRTRLKAKNLMYIKQILFILSNFVKTLGGKAGSQPSLTLSSKPENRLQTINDFLFDTHLDNLNLFKVVKYCKRSLISRKLLGFLEKYSGDVQVHEKKKSEDPSARALSNFLREISQSKENATTNSSSNVAMDSVKTTASIDNQTSFASPLMHIEGFLEALTTADKDGRIFIDQQELLGKSSLKFLLLNPAVHFADIVAEARAVIIAGGTMQPVSEFKEQLLYSTGTKPERVMEFSCGHVIPREHLLPIALARGSSGLLLDFTYQSRGTPAMMSELGRVVCNMANVVIGGVVCFFPSYEYEKTVYAHWEQAGFLEKINQKKKVFREPKQANEVDKVLQDYTAFIKRHSSKKFSQYNGALLCCVIGGKMSEGINFSDELGRCIIIVGLPYPNARSAELKEKMDYLNASMPRSDDGRQAGQIHFENLCMKAVNQSIGRAIRHKNDYASILLLDHRYLRSNVQSKLPHWISDRLLSMERFGPAFSSVRKFFAERTATDSSQEETETTKT